MKHDGSPVNPAKSPWGWIWLALALLVLAAFWACGDFCQVEANLGAWHDHNAQLKYLIDRHWLSAVLLVFVVHALLAALGLPGASLLMLAAGSGFGALLGTLLCLTGCTAGATLAMLASRRWLQPWVRRRHGPRLAGFDAHMAADAPACLFSLRLLPVIPFTVVNLAAGLTPIRTWTYVWVSFAGMAAGTFVYVNAGTELGHVRQLSDLHSPQILVSLAALALLPWLIKPLVRRLQAAAGA